MIDDETIEQPPATCKPPSDFNDLHDLSGIDAVKAQIAQALATLAPLPTPETPDNAANQSIGQIAESEPVFFGEIPHPDDFVLDYAPPDGEPPTGGQLIERGSGADESDDQKMQKWISRFCLIEGKTDVWDSYSKTVWKKTAFMAMLGGKRHFDDWLSHSHRKSISRDDVDGLINDDSHRQAREMQERFIMLEGKKACWDTFRRELISTDVMRENWSGAYDLWIKSNSKRMIWHEDLVFAPSMEISEGQINTFDGMHITPLLDDDGNMISQIDAMDSCMAILQLIAELGHGENEATNWLVKWLAYPLQNMGAKMDTSVLVASKVQGSGKSLFFEKIMGRIYGDKYSVTLGQNGLESIYTDWAERKLYCLFEEVFNNKSKFGMMGLIKHMVTGEKIRIEKKFMSGYSQNNHINCVFLSNEIQPLAIDEPDRRFCVLAPERKLKDEIKQKIDEYLNDPQLTAIRAFYTYLLQVDMTDFNQHTPPPMTAAKDNIIHFGLPSWKLFLNDWQNHILDYPYVCCLSDDLYDAYRKWCQRRGEKPIPDNKFLHFIANEPDIKKGHGRIYKDALNGSFNQNANCEMVQRRIVFTAQQPPDTKQADWLSLQVKQFNASLYGDRHDPF